MYRFFIIIYLNSVAAVESTSDALRIGDLQRTLRGHPLFFGITMGLMAEIINSRYNVLHTCSQLDPKHCLSNAVIIFVLFKY